jgi:hypothetical protein
MMMNKALIKVSTNEIIRKTDIPILKDLVQNPQTKKQGLAIVKQASVTAFTQMWLSKISVHNTYREQNLQLIEQNKDLIDINTGAINYDGLVDRFQKYMSEYVDTVDGESSVNWGKILIGFFNVPGRIHSISVSNHIIEICDKIKEKYHTDNGSPFYLENKLKKGLKEITAEAENDAFYKRMKALGPKDFFYTAITGYAGLGDVLEEFGRDAKELNEWYGERIKILKKRGQI